MKALLRLLLCLMLCLLFAVPGTADTTEGDFMYYIDETIGGAVLTGYSGSEANVILPDTLGGYPLLRVSFGSFSSNASIVSVTLPDSVQYMEGGAFAGCSSLTDVYLPENLIELTNADVLGNYNSYVDKDSATALLMASAADFIDPDYPAFKLRYIESPVTAQTVLGMSKYIGAEETVIIPDGVSHIGDSAFMIGISGAEVNTWTKAVRMPTSVISMGMAALYSIPNLAEVYLSPNISSWYHTTQPWEAGAFDTRGSAKLYCSLDSTTFRTMTLDVTSLGIVGPGAPDYAWQNDGSGRRILARYYGSATRLTIPDGTTAISNNAFIDNSTLTSITIPESVTTIGDRAFEYSDYGSNPSAYPERTIYLPDNVTFTGSQPFDTYKSTLIVKHDSATAKDLMRLNDEFGEILYVFSDPDYPDYLLGHLDGELYLRGYIGSDTVMNIPPICDVIAEHVNLRTPASGAITHINVPEGVTRLQERAFWGWPVLKTISLPSTLRTIGEYAFSNNNLPVLIIPDGVTALPAYMNNNSIIRYVTIPASVTSIDETALITSGSMRTYKIYCNKGSYAEKWAKAHSVPVGYLENADYTFYVSEQFIGDVGDTVNWRETVVVAPMEPDFPYTITAKSSKPSVVSVNGDNLSFNGFGQASLTFTSEELGYATTIKAVYAYEPVEHFTVPEYIFAKFRSKGTISVSNVVPAKNTNPAFRWWRPEVANVLGSHMADIEKYPMYDVNMPGVFPFTVSSKSGVSRSFTFVHYQTLGAMSFGPFTGLLAEGMTVTPDISATIDSIVYHGTVGTYTLASSNTKIAKPTADGKLELLAPGTATITATFLSGKTAKQTITVSDEKVYTIAAGVKEIEQEAFISCPVTIAVIPDGCESIGKRAFANCASLYLIEIPSSVSHIADDAFDGCENLTIVSPAGSYAESYAKVHGLAAGEE